MTWDFGNECDKLEHDRHEKKQTNKSKRHIIKKTDTNRYVFSPHAI